VPLLFQAEVGAYINSSRSSLDVLAMVLVKKGTIDDLLMSLVLSSAVQSDELSFNPRSVLFAKLNRAELGNFDALVLSLFLMAHFKRQVVVPDFGFYGREGHVSLIRKNRLIAGVNSLAELSPKLRQSVLLISEREGKGTTFEDAQTLAKYAGLRPDQLREDNDYHR
jgi:hypothetical protein